MTYMILIIATVLNATANFTLKLAASQTGGLSIETIKNPLLWLALVLFGANILGYLLYLQRVQLAVAYPTYVGLTFVIVLALSVFVLKETVSVTQGIGVALIFAGVLLAAR